MTNPALVLPGSMGVLLSIEHNHGTDITVHPDIDAAFQALHEYVRSNWESSEALPADLDEAIRAYFEDNEEIYETQGFTVS